MIIITEADFVVRLMSVLPANDNIGAVTGPGRSGAVAAVYASHILGVPFIPYGSPAPEHLGQLLIVDTAQRSAALPRKAVSRYQNANPVVVVAFEEPPRVSFWYEAARGRHGSHGRKEPNGIR